MASFNNLFLFYVSEGGSSGVGSGSGSGLVTRTEQVALLPLAVFTVTITVPSLRAVTLPFSTVIIPVLLVIQVNVLFVVLSGLMVAFN